MKIRTNKFAEHFFSIVLLLYSVLAFFLPTIVTKAFVEWMFIAYVVFIGYNIYDNKRITLFQIWNISFVYVIISEMIKITHGDFVSEEYQYAIAFLLLANSIFIMGYEIVDFKVHKWIKVYDYKISHKKFFIMMLVMFALLYLYFKIGRAVSVSSQGRKVAGALGSGNVVNTFVNAIGLLTPSLIGYYFACHTKNKWVSLLFVIPLFAVQFLISTRFRVLYMAMPYFILMGIIPLKIDKIRKILILGLLLVAFSVGSTYLKKYRYVSSIEELDWSVLYTESSNRFVSIANKMSPEGVVRMTVLANDYFKTHPLSQGRETSYVTYFWVPRSVWKDKPIPIDYWLIREYEEIGESVTTASGFTGEIRADFGNYCFIIVFLWGLCLKYLDVLVASVDIKRKSFNNVLYAMLFPWIFFFVRSPSTATISFLLEVFLFLFVRRLFTKRDVFRYGKGLLGVRNKK